MSDSVDHGPVNGTPPGEPDPRLAPVIRIVVKVKGSSVGVQTNHCTPGQAINFLTAAIVALAQQMARDKQDGLWTPSAGPPPLRRLPNV